MRYAVRINGFDTVAITKLDVLTGLPSVRVCTAYDTPRGRVRDFPIDELEPSSGVTPVYEDLPGWSQGVGEARALSDLPAEAQEYLRRIEAEVGVPLYLVSVGSRRGETIVLQDPFGSGGAAR